MTVSFCVVIVNLCLTGFCCGELKSFNEHLCFDGNYVVIELENLLYLS